MRFSTHYSRTKMNNESEREKLDLDTLKHLRERWWHEDHLVNQRLTWLLTSQTLLFAALAWLIPLREDDDLWIWMIIVGGVLTSSIVLTGIEAAKRAQDDLLGKWPEIREGIDSESRELGSLTSLALPYIFIFAWVLAFSFLIIEGAGSPRGVYKVPGRYNTQNFFLICKTNKIPRCFEEAEKTCARRNMDLAWIKDKVTTIKPDLMQVTDRETMLSYTCEK
jgi:hypothetical protein